MPTLTVTWRWAFPVSCAHWLCRSLRLETATCRTGDLGEGNEFTLLRLKKVGKPGLEPGRLAAHDPKSCSSTDSDTSPHGEHGHYSPASLRDAIEHGWANVPGRGFSGSQPQTVTIAWPPPLSGGCGGIGSGQVASCEMVAA